MMPDINVCPVCTVVPLEDNGSSVNISWIQCDVCHQWFHSACIKLTQAEVANVYAYHCTECLKKHGPPVYKRKSKRSKIQIDYSALNEGDLFAVDKTVHPHVDNFQAFGDDELGNDPDTGYVEITDNLTKNHILLTKLFRPVMVPQAALDVVGMSLPQPKDKITIEYITNAVGEDSHVEVMDVLSQQGVSPGWDMAQWRDYFALDEGSRDRIRNVISLEISQTQDLGTGFVRPKFVRDMDLVDKVWIDDKNPRPQVTTYALMSVKGSFTDFHIDFGGTSVYYTVCCGSKTFLMFPPSDTNLHLYTSWCQEPNQNYIWFPDYSKSIKGSHCKPTQGFKVTLHPGDLFAIPSGWIHAVYTPSDSIVIGGNFLTLMNIPMQLKINDVEKATRVPSKFRFPLFNKVLWLASWYYYNHQHELASDAGISQSDRRDIVASLIDHLEGHYQLSKTNLTARRAIPTDIIGKDVAGYLDGLRQWIRTADDVGDHVKSDNSRAPTPKQEPA